MHTLPQSSAGGNSAPALPALLDPLRRQVALSLTLHGIIGDLTFYGHEPSRELAVRLLVAVLDRLSSSRQARTWTVDELKDALCLALAAGGESL